MTFFRTFDTFPSAFSSQVPLLRKVLMESIQKVTQKLLKSEKQFRKVKEVQKKHK